MVAEEEVGLDVDDGGVGRLSPQQQLICTELPFFFLREEVNIKYNALYTRKYAFVLMNNPVPSHWGKNVRLFFSKFSPENGSLVKI